jgi:hypothetical protein
MELEFTGIIWYWRGPAPWYFVTVPEEPSLDLKTASKLVTYGWGMIPVVASIGKTKWKTSLFPKDSLYVVPIKTDVRKAEHLQEDNSIMVRLEVLI